THPAVPAAKAANTIQFGLVFMRSDSSAIRFKRSGFRVGVESISATILAQTTWKPGDKDAMRPSTKRNQIKRAQFRR
ncbi:MAG: hypothetical protein ACI9VS_004017, partial [Candidatus Binatia bacterium]